MEGEQEAKVDMEELPKELPTGEVVDDQLIMLSGLPKIRWQNLLSLDALRVCCRCLNYGHASWLINIVNNRNEVNQRKHPKRNGRPSSFHRFVTWKRPLARQRLRMKMRSSLA